MMIKKVIIFVLVAVLVLSACGSSQHGIVTESFSDALFTEPTIKPEQDTSSADSTAVAESEEEIEEPLVTPEPEEEGADPTPFVYEPSFESFDDAELSRYIEDSIYTELVEDLNSDDYYVESIRTAHISQEYIDQLAFNSMTNVFFGHSLKELDEAFQGERYIFTLGENGETIVTTVEEYNGAYEKVLKNVAVGTGVILICVTVSVLSAGMGAPAVSMVFAASAKTGTMMALSSGALGAIAAGIMTGIETHDMKKALDAAALAGSEGFKWGAISGAVAGGFKEFFVLKDATLNGLTMNQAALIQSESNYPLDVIRQFHSMDEYEVFKSANLKPLQINGQTALIQPDINLNLVDEYGRTNLQRMSVGLAPLDSNGLPYELHHIGQNADATLAVLTRAQHDSPGLHGFKMVSEIDRPEFNVIRQKFWKTVAAIMGGSV